MAYARSVPSHTSVLRGRLYTFHRRLRFLLLLHCLPGLDSCPFAVDFGVVVVGVVFVAVVGFVDSVDVAVGFVDQSPVADDVALLNSLEYFLGLCGCFGVDFAVVVVHQTLD